MKLLLIRHADAVDPSSFKGSDLQRPLTPEGQKKARQVLKVVARLYPDLQVILTSQACRAIETAKLLARYAFPAKIVRSKELNPGCGLRNLGRALASLPGNPTCVAVVGHEPDLSKLLSAMVADNALRVEFKKTTCAEVVVNRLLKGELKLLLPARALTKGGKAI